MKLIGNRLLSPGTARVYLSRTSLKLIHSVSAPATSCQSHKPLQDLDLEGVVAVGEGGGP
jgi:hypothetical protein